ncbi:hypothetical protein HC931_06235 [Candidatus Gracilibacteria bacterium]|jgi:hypothetical protein|nr:hypothetical protein [Candidatus Gracilibacteria bacterium]NJM87890.1 hypothetical protein [Hydrococcus sp. RU_2_2]NJP18543.1 hypothetical protein [Hydrococcus sp. CRU_1_1]NJQ97952.1 hypothetical protein [Hydrococcus sp. CSU_1_8]
MERGLLWLPLLVVFFWLAWTGWNEYQKVEAYRRWAESFDRSKYDIYAVLGQKGKNLTWGRPTRSEPVEVKTVSLDCVESISLLVNGRPVELDPLPERGQSAIALSLIEADTMQIPFTEISLAAQWTKYLQQELEKIKAQN